MRGPGNDVTALASPEAAAMTSTERLANDLSAAGTAFERSDLATLETHLRAIELAGASPSDRHSEETMLEWRSVVSKDALPMRGRALGPAYISGTLAPGATLDTEQVLLGGKSVGIAAGTTPQGGLRLRVSRGDGKAVCERSPAHARECRFVPAYTQRYRIELFNSGTGNARYHIVLE
ncbi:hypothetical protein EH31_16960 [Erythrobacter longus]|uniref:Uncharacterized protein n=2 Tax=Erythrobacter longus TaxID=1044 RepID=A0A074M2K8_ERYLO|nr:hypothetical protein EH31_16960 [Erythrobacter longus]